jgi:hypothetical protein
VEAPDEAGSPTEQRTDRHSLGPGRVDL